MKINPDTKAIELEHPQLAELMKQAHPTPHTTSQVLAQMLKKYDYNFAKDAAEAIKTLDKA
jgi:hypothetical protein